MKAIPSKPSPARASLSALAREVEAIPDNPNLPKGAISMNDRKDVIRGWQDVPLNADGKKQAADMGNHIARLGGLDSIQAADQKRHMSTAQAIKSANPSTQLLATSRDLRPWHSGFEAKPTKDILEKMNYMIQNTPDEKIEAYDPKLGPNESFNEFLQRTLPAIQAARNFASKNPDKKIGIVTSFRNLKAVEAWSKAGYKKDLTVDGPEMLRHDGEPGSVTHMAADGKLTNIDLASEKNPLKPGLYIIRHGLTDWNG